MDVVSRSVQTAPQPLANASGLICGSVERSAPSVRVLDASTECHGSECLFNQLDDPSRVLVPPSPFALIPCCLAKIKKEKVEAVLVCLLWTSQPWFPLLLEMTVEMPRVFRSHPILLHSSLLEPHPLLQSGKFLLSAWRLSGNASFCEAFRQRSLRCCWPVQEELLSLPISRPGTIYCAGNGEGFRSFVKHFKHRFAIFNRAF